MNYEQTEEILVRHGNVMAFYQSRDMKKESWQKLLAKHPDAEVRRVRVATYGGFVDV